MRQRYQLREALWLGSKCNRYKTACLFSLPNRPSPPSETLNTKWSVRTPEFEGDSQGNRTLDFYTQGKSPPVAGTPSYDPRLSGFFRGPLIPESWGSSAWGDIELQSKSLRLRIPVGPLGAL